MYANNLEQLISFLYFILTGIILGVIFDIFRILRRSFKTSDFLTNIEDVMFGMLTGFTILFSIFLLNNGELRLYIFIGMLIGILFYMLFVSKYFIQLNVWIIHLIKKTIFLLTKPFRICLKLLKKLFFRPISFIIINMNHFLYKIGIIFKKTTKIHKKANKEEGF